jgi:dihydroxy-acid dehydratase
VVSPGDSPATADEAFARFLREAFLESTGLSRESFDRPVIGIASTASDFNPCHATAPALIDAIRRGVTMAGGLPFAFPTISLHESFAYPSSLILRNLLAMDTEEMLRALPVDAVVLVGGLRQDDSRANHGRDQRRRPGARGAGRPDAGRA